MPGELLLVNPRHKRRRARRRGKRRLSALQRFYFGGRRSKRRRARKASRRRARHHVRRRRHSVSTPPVTVLATNPRTRSRSRSGVKGLTGMIVPAAVGAAGAIATDFAMGMLPLPAALTTGFTGILVKGAAAIAVGTVAGMALGRSTGNAVALGALTVVAFDAFQTFSGQMGTMASGGGPRVGRYVRLSGRTGWTVPGLGFRRARMRMGKLGYMSPARPMGRARGLAPLTVRKQLMQGMRVGRYVPA